MRSAPNRNIDGRVTMQSSRIAPPHRMSTDDPHTVSPESQHESGPPDPSQRGSAPRTGIACFTCRSKKVKCSGRNPCSYCEKRGLDCVFQTQQKRKLFPVSQIEDLETRAALYAGEHSTLSNEGNTAPDDAQCIEPARSVPETLRESSNGRVTSSQISASPSTNSRSIGQHHPPGMRPHAPIRLTNVSCTESSASTRPRLAGNHALSSTRNFGSEVQKLLDPQAEQSPCERPAPHLDVSDMSSVCSPDGAPLSVASLLPSEFDARRCLEAVAFNFGESQHFIDLRIFSDDLDSIYDGTMRVQDLLPLQLLEVLLVLALGKQILGVKLPNETFPGETVFKGAVSRLPSFSELKRIGVPMVNILALAAIYFQNLDMAEDALFYSGTALRIALLNRMHRRHSSERVSRSQRLHLNRLWWTVYMQERRLAVSMGSPIAIQDSDIDADLPVDGHGFISAKAMAINLKIARISGSILASLYLNEPATQDVLIESVRGVIRSLYETARAIPPELSISFASTPLQVSRTSASLYLMLYQAMMYAIRPILVHLAKSRIGIVEAAELEPASQLYKLAGTCAEAAQRSNSVLEALYRQGVLGAFTFGDLDTLFSSTFVLVLSRIIGLNKPEAAIRATQTACSILESMERDGNLAAGQRRRDILRMDQKLATLLSSEQRDSSSATENNDPTFPSAATEARATEPGEPMNVERGFGISSGPGPLQDSNQGLPALGTTDGASDNSYLAYGNLPLSNAWPGGPDPLSLSNEIVGTEDLANDPGLYAVYHDQDTRFSGVDYLDWVELERCVEQAHHDLRNNGP